MSITERWTGFFLSTPYELLPADLVQHGKRVLLDYLGVALAGAETPMARIAANYFANLGGRPQASVFLRPERLPAVNAALVNGVLGHALDLDDGHRAAAGHPGIATLPAALAAAEAYRASGPELLRAIVFGYEVFVRLAAFINPEHLRRGFHTTATVGPFAAAAAAATLLRLDQERFVRALGLAGVQGAGLMEVFHDGAMTKPFQTARASSAGLLAVELAAQGADGPRTVLEGDKGFLGAMGGSRAAEPLADDLGRDWAIRGVYFKLHAACRHTHAAVDAAAQLRQEHGLQPEQVCRAVVRTYSVAQRLCGDPRPPDGPSEAKFSLPFTVALGLTYGHAGQSCFTPALVADPALRALAARVSVEVDPAIEQAFPTRRISVLELVTNDGRELRTEVPVVRGEPELPLSEQELEQKFLDNALARLGEGRARAIVEQVRRLETLPSCTTLLDLLAGRPVSEPVGTSGAS